MLISIQRFVAAALVVLLAAVAPPRARAADLIDTIVTDMYSLGIAVNSANNRIYVIGQSAEPVVLEIDGGTDQITTTVLQGLQIPVGPSPYHPSKIALNAATDRLYIVGTDTSTGSTVIAVYDGNDNSVTLVPWDTGTSGESPSTPTRTASTSRATWVPR